MINEHIKVGTEKDLDQFLDDIIRDEEAYFHLGMQGIPDYSKKNDRWNVCLYVDNVGFIRFYVHGEPTSVYICALYVKKILRRKGWGKKLIEAAIELATRSYNFFYIYALTLENKPMEKLLLNLGFEEAGTYSMSHRQKGKWISQTKWIKKGNI